jgi:uncharacterized protein
MHEPGTAAIIAQTKKWIADVVAGCNFCPFAAREIKRGSIRYEVLHQGTMKTALEGVAVAFAHLDNHPETETSFLILPGSFAILEDYLQLVDLSDGLIEKENFEGIYQVASFHPAYLFAGSNEQDPSNYTNRSPYPMLHFLREDSISKAVDSYPDIDDVPERNISFTQEKGLKYMQQLLASCMHNDGE